MIKNDLGKFSAPYFEETLDNGLKVVFLPRKSELNSALLYVPSGAYLHVDEIDGVRIPSATGYLVKETILSEKTKDEFLKEGVLASTLYDYSYTGYQLTSYHDVFPAVQKLLNKIRTLDFTEEEIESFKKTHQAMKEETPLEKVKNATLDELFTSSPLKNGLTPSMEELKSVHRSTVKKYLSKYYPCNHLTLFLSMDLGPMDVSDRIRELKVPGKQEPKYKEKKILEKDELLVPYKEIHVKSDQDYLTFGIKLRKREKLYETYGQLLFCFYEILTDSLFIKNDDFLDGVRKAQASLVDVELRQGFEEACALLSFSCSSSTKIITFVNSYLANITNHVSKSFFKEIKEWYYTKALRTLSSPTQALVQFAKAEADLVPYTGLAGYITKLSYSNYAKFLKQEISTGKKTACYLIHRQ